MRDQRAKADRLGRPESLGTPSGPRELPDTLVSLEFLEPRDPRDSQVMMERGETKDPMGFLVRRGLRDFLVYLEGG